jgi:hypothetical protein
VQLSRDTEARVADTIREASSVPEGNDASPLPLVVSAAETAGRTLPVDWRQMPAASASSACRYSRSTSASSPASTPRSLLQWRAHPPD